jgi:hypothetical protein
LGAGRGWTKLKFLITPEELASLLTGRDLILAVTDSRVPADYESTPAAEYVAAYASYVEAVFADATVPHHLAMGLYMSVASSLDVLTAETCPDARYKLLHPHEPLINLSPLELYYVEGKLSTSMSGNVHFGLEMAFPKVISLAQERHEVLHGTGGYPSAALFADLRAQLGAVTSPCRIESPVKVHRTDVRISSSMRERARLHPGLAAQGLRVV